MRLMLRRRYDGPRWIETMTSYFLGWLALAVGAVLIVGFLLMAMMTAARPSLAESIQYPVTIPAECVELAQREGQPIIIENRAQGIRAKARLWRLSARDPLVKQCRDAVDRLNATQKAMQ